MISRNTGFCRKEKSVCLKLQLDVAGRERAGDERGQKRADAHRCRHADPLEDVEGEMHGAVP